MSVERCEHGYVGDQECVRCLTERAAELRVRVRVLEGLLRLYATSDCPSCFALARMVDTQVETWPNGNQTVRGGRWHVEHYASCDIGCALATLPAPPQADAGQRSKNMKPTWYCKNCGCSEEIETSSPHFKLDLDETTACGDCGSIARVVDADDPLVFADADADSSAE